MGSESTNARRTQGSAVSISPKRRWQSNLIPIHKRCHKIRVVVQTEISIIHAALYYLAEISLLKQCLFSCNQIWEKKIYVAISKNNLGVNDDAISSLYLVHIYSLGIFCAMGRAVAFQFLDDYFFSHFWLLTYAIVPC